MTSEFKLSNNELVAPLVRDYLEAYDTGFLEEGDLRALDFALNWTQAEVTAELNKQWDNQFAWVYGVQYGYLPNIRVMEMPNLEIAQKVAGPLNGTVMRRRTGYWSRVPAE